MSKPNESSLLSILPDKEIKQLTIFEQNKPHGRPENDDGAVEVSDLCGFFKDPAVLERIGSIEKLIVYGKKGTLVDFKLAKFDQLAHLELYNLLFVNPNILKSFKLQHLVLNCVCHHMGRVSEEETTEQVPSEVFFSGLADLQSEILYLTYNQPLGARAFTYILEKGIFQAIERLCILPTDLSLLGHLSDNYPALKRVDLACERNLLKQLTCGLNLRKILRQLRPGLSIFVGGIPLRYATVERIVDAVNHMRPGNSPILKEEFLVSDEHGFPGLFRQMYLELFQFNSLRLSKVNVCGKIKFYLNKFVDTKADLAVLDSIFDLRQVSIKCYTDLDYQFYELIIEHLQQRDQITHLAFEIWNYFDFTFLLQFPELQELSLRTIYPISLEVILELLVTLRHLEYLDLLFPKPVELDAVKCADFQNLVDDQLAVCKFEPKGLKFEVKILDFVIPLVRYRLKNKQTMSIDAHLWSAESRNRMFRISERFSL